jgi:hypothetical protein
MGNNIGPPLEGTAIDRSGKGVVDDERHAVRVGSFCKAPISSTVSAGFAIVSPKTAFVFGLNAFSNSSLPQSGETKVNSIPIRLMVTAKRLYVPPYMVDEDTTWSPRTQY